MNTDDPQADRPQARSDWFGNRKRIIAREVPRGESDGAVEAEMKAASRIDVSPVILSDAPGSQNAARTEAVLDPTLFGERQRKSGHQLVYRLAQGATLMAFLAAASAIACAIAEHVHLSQMLALSACLLALVSLRMVRSSQLVYRLRGYVAAACILSVIALALSLMPGLFNDDGKPAPHAAPKPAPVGADPS